MLNLAFCDDNELQREIVSDLLEDYIRSRGIELKCDGYTDGAELIKAVRAKGAYSIYLLDIMMEDMDGMDTAYALRKMNDKGRIIFLTASMEFGIASYGVDAFYYMLKPIDRLKFFGVLDRAFDAIRAEAASKIPVKTDRGEMRVDPSEVTYVQLVKRVPVFHLSNGTILESAGFKGSFEELVAPLASASNFSMCGNDMVICLDQVDAVVSGLVLLRSGEMLNVNRGAAVNFKKVWKAYKETY